MAARGRRGGIDLKCGGFHLRVKSLSWVRLLATAWTAANQAPLSMGFSRQEYWSGMPLPSPPGLPVYHQLPEFTQIYVHRVSDAIQPSHLCRPPLQRYVCYNQTLTLTCRYHPKVAYSMNFDKYNDMYPSLY